MTDLPHHPPELALQRLLRTEGLAALLPLAIKARPHPQYPNLHCFKYDQRLSPMSEEAVRDARGLILDQNDDWAVVSMSFRKFFNLGESLAVPIDWETARIEDKLDGTLMSLYWYDRAWQVQTTGTADAGGMVMQDIRTRHEHLTFRDLFWQTWKELSYQLPPVPDELGAAYTFAFELLTPMNRVVVHHETTRLVLHGVRRLDTLQEEKAEDWAEKLGYEATRTFDLTQEDLREAARQIPPDEGEGFVVRDAHFNRVKVKSEAYVTVSLVREAWSPRRALELVLLGEQEEFLTYFPEYRQQLAEIEQRVRRVTDELDATYAELTSLPDQKAFAAQALKNENSAALFQLRLGRFSDAYAWLLSLTEAQRLRALSNAGEDFTG